MSTYDDTGKVGYKSEGRAEDIDAVALVTELRNHGNYSLGVLLTGVEAALGDSKQAQALKAIVRREMFLMIERNQAEIYERYGMQRPGLAPKEMFIDGQDGLDDTASSDQ